MNVIISGASKGIGKAIAETFASHGHTLYLCARSEDALNKTAQELQKKYPASTIKAKVADVTNANDRKVFAVWVLKIAATIDVLVNNAGSYLPGSVHNETAGTLEEMMSVNLYSAYHLTRLFINQMMEQKAGHVFNMCSIASLNAYHNGGSYSISKFALLGFSKNLREEMKPYGVKVTAIMPGATMSDSWAGAEIDPQRIMEANDVAQMVYTASQLSPQAVVEDIVLRPQLGDL
ncbi:MAG: SDR family oxidoreductase [Chitinophagaceae bacterium]